MGSSARGGVVGADESEEVGSSLRRLVEKTRTHEVLVHFEVRPLVANGERLSYDVGSVVGEVGREEDPTHAADCAEVRVEVACSGYAAVLELLGVESGGEGFVVD